jgi:hypothetical protein
MKFLLLAITLFSSSLFADVLDEKVPWTGQVKRQQLGELLARIQGWAEAEGHKDFHLDLNKIDPKLRNSPVMSFNVSTKITYRELINSAFSHAGSTVAIVRKDARIQAVLLVTIRIRIPAKIVNHLNRSGKKTAEGIKEILTEKGWKFSPHFEMNLFSDENLIIARGTSDDAQKLSRFFKG